MEKTATSIQDLLSITGLQGSLSKVLGALVILTIGWFVSKFFKKIIYKLLSKSKWEKKLLGESSKDMNLSKMISKFVYYIFMMIILLVVLELLGINQVLDPIKNMLNKFLTFIPNIIAAGVVGFVGYIIAKIVANLIGIAGNFLDKMVEKIGFKDTDKLISILNKVVFIVILIPFLIQSLNILNLDIITNPANNILNSVLNILPKLLGTGIIIALFVVGGRFLCSFLNEFLKSMGTDTLSEKLQLDVLMGNNQSLSKIVSNTVYFFLVLFGIITGIEVLELVQLTEILNTISNLTGQIVFGVLILVFGNFIATTIYKTLAKSETNELTVSIVRYAVMALFFAMAFRTMGIANSIIDLAFGLVLGSISVAIALSYGLGGREAAGHHMKEILDKLRSKKKAHFQ